MLSQMEDSKISKIYFVIDFFQKVETMDRLDALADYSEMEN